MIYPNEIINVSQFLLSNSHRIPILQETHYKLTDLFEKNAYDQHLDVLSEIVLQDPFLSLKILVSLSYRKKTSLSLDVDSINKCIMLIGMKEVFNIALNSSVCMMHDGLNIAIQRARYAAAMANKISIIRYDILPEEVALSALLADLGELMLWVFKPELTTEIRQAMLDGKYNRNQNAQLAIANFKFKDLSIILAKEWFLPEPIIEIIDYANHTQIRAKVAKICVDLARHIYEPKGDLAIPDDINQLHDLINLNKITDIVRLLDLNSHLDKSQLQYVIQHSK